MDARTRPQIIKCTNGVGLYEIDTTHETFDTYEEALEGLDKLTRTRQVNLTDEEFTYLELLIHNHEYEENDRELINSLEAKFYKAKSNSYKNKLTKGLE